MAHVLIPVPHQDFDPSEVAVPWRILSEAGHRATFATPDGRVASADPIMLSGEGLDPWGFVPGLRKLRLFGLLLRANADRHLLSRQAAEAELKLLQAQVEPHFLFNTLASEIGRAHV